MGLFARLKKVWACGLEPHHSCCEGQKTRSYRWEANPTPHVVRGRKTRRSYSWEATPPPQCCEGQEDRKELWVSSENVSQVNHSATWGTGDSGDCRLWHGTWKSAMKWQETDDPASSACQSTARNIWCYSACLHTRDDKRNPTNSSQRYPTLVSLNMWSGRGRSGMGATLNFCGPWGY